MSSITYLGIDYGTRKIGLAIGVEGMAFPLGIIVTAGAESYIRRVCEERRVTDIVVGMAYHIDGRRSEQMNRTEGFIQRLRAVIPESIRIHREDERLSTSEAYQSLRESGISHADVGKVDDVAAVIILQDFLDRHG